MNGGINIFKILQIGLTLLVSLFVFRFALCACLLNAKARSAGSSGQ